MLEQGASWPCSLGLPVECSFVGGKQREYKIGSGLYHVSYVIDLAAQFISHLCDAVNSMDPSTTVQIYRVQPHVIGHPFQWTKLFLLEREGGKEGRGGKVMDN